MSLLGVVIMAVGLPALLAPGWVRETFGLRATPPVAYGLRLFGAMSAALGAILLLFAWTYQAALG